MVGVATLVVLDGVVVSVDDDALEDCGDVVVAALMDAAEVLGGVLEALAEPLVHPATSAAEPPISSARREVLTAEVAAVRGGSGWVNGRLQETRRRWQQLVQCTEEPVRAGSP